MFQLDAPKKTGYQQRGLRKEVREEIVYRDAAAPVQIYQFFQLDTPTTPNISSEGRGGGDSRDSEEEIGSAASFLIRWLVLLLRYWLIRNL